VNAIWIQIIPSSTSAVGRGDNKAREQRPANHPKLISTINNRNVNIDEEANAHGSSKKIMPARRARRMTSFLPLSTTADFFAGDEIKFIICSFSHGDNIISSWCANGGLGNRNDNREEGPGAKSFTLYGYLSKNWYASCI